MSSSRGVEDGEDIWDDDMIMNDWKEMLGEYQKYHSMAARGEKVAKVVKSVKTGPYADMLEDVQENGPTDDMSSKAALAKENQVQAGDIEMAGDENLEDVNTAVADKVSTRDEDITYPPDPCEDEAVKNLARAWYWAGYYAGQYNERKRVAEAQKSEKPTNMAQVITSYPRFLDRDRYYMTGSPPPQLRRSWTWPIMDFGDLDDDDDEDDDETL